MVASDQVKVLPLTRELPTETPQNSLFFHDGVQAVGPFSPAVHRRVNAGDVPKLPCFRAIDRLKAQVSENAK